MLSREDECVALRRTLGEDRVMAIVRYRRPGNLSAALNAIVTGGVRVLEVTVDTPGCWEAIADTSILPGVYVGAGTVTEVEQVTRLAAAGGRFIVSPGFDETVVRAAIDAGLEVFPGVMTGSEILKARSAGSGFFKLFPAGSLGTRYLSELRGPFSREAFVPTGGIRIAEIPQWLEAGAFAVAVGSDLAGREAPRTVADVADLVGRAEEAINQARVSEHAVSTV